MTEYTLRTTIACPSHMMDDANQLALTLGESAHDDQTFQVASYQDEANNTYAIASTVVRETFQTTATSTLIAPEHAPHVNLEAATRAQKTLVISTLENPTPATENHVTAIVGPATETAQSHIEALQLTRIENEELPL